MLKLCPTEDGKLCMLPPNSNHVQGSTTDISTKLHQCLHDQQFISFCTYKQTDKHTDTRLNNTGFALQHGLHAVTVTGL